MRVVQIRMTLNALLDYYNTTYGDPVSQEIIDNGLAQASEVLSDSTQKHPIIVASVFIRISIEQTLRSLCNLNQIQHGPTTKAKILNEKLCGADVYTSDVMSDIQSHLDFLNAIVHGKASPPIEKVRESLEWSNRFISRYLPSTVN